MPVINGEKWACTSCIKGHRVSGCNHNDRELHHINPKGRPVKQCEHCRGARKSKSHHAKCDCGDKKDKDKLKDKGDAKGEISASANVDDVSNHAAVTEGQCCCHSGSKCICGVKQETLDLKLDTGKQTLHAARTKPKLTTTHSESTLTIFANGHHKPCHRNNNSAHVSGVPYKLGRPHTLHGSAAFANFAQGNSCTRSDMPAQRAMDTLSLSNNDFHTMFGSAQRSMDGLPSTPMTGSLDTSNYQDSLFNTQSTMFSQEANSPEEAQLSDVMSTQQWPWTSTMTPATRNFGFGSLSTSPSQDCLPNLESDWAIPSAGLNNPLWSAGDLPLDPSKLSDTLAQPISHSGESNKHSNPGLTTASSSHSENGEPVLYGDYEIKNPPSTASETLFWEDSPAFHLATSGPTPAPTSIPAYVDDTQLSKSMVSLPTTMASTDSFDVTASYSTPGFTETSAIAVPNDLEDVVPNDWMMDQNANMFGANNTFEMSFPNWI